MASILSRPQCINDIVLCDLVQGDNNINTQYQDNVVTSVA